MANINSITSASNKIGSPITLSVTAAKIGTEQKYPSFHNVIIVVTATMSSYVDASGTTIPASQFECNMTSAIIKSYGTEEERTTIVDVSSVLRALADRFVYEATVLTLPTFAFSALAYDEWMIDGEIKDNKSSASTFEQPDIIYSMGSYTELERFLAGDFKNALPSTDAHLYSRKPKEQYEIVYYGTSFVYPTSHYQSEQIDLTDKKYQEGKSFSIGGHLLYVFGNKPKNVYQFRFVNGLGLIESIAIKSLKKESVNLSSSFYHRALPETFGSISRGINSKINDRNTWAFTSGPQTEAWIAWFVHEFLMTPYAWMQMEFGGQSYWIPCHIMADEKIEYIDDTSGKMLSVTLTVQFDLSGPLESAMLV